VLWSRTPGFVDDRGEVLRTKGFNHLALADPRLAPYGAASLQVLKALGLLETLQPRFVTAANNTQAYQFVASGNAELQTSGSRRKPEWHFRLEQRSFLLRFPDAGIPAG